MRFASFLFGGFITAIIVINPPERKLAKRTSVQRKNIFKDTTFRGISRAYICSVDTDLDALEQLTIPLSKLPWCIVLGFS